MSTHLRICVALGAALWMARARAADVATSMASEATSAAPTVQTPRTLNGTVFQPYALMTGPFTTTSFGVDTLFGTGTVDAPRYDLQGNVIGSRKYDTIAYGENIDASFRLLSNLSLRLSVNGLVFSGTGSRGLLVVGGTVQVGVLAGLTWGWTFTPAMRIAFVLDSGTTPQLSILIGNAVLRALQNRIFDGTGILSEVNNLRSSAGVSYAWAPLAGLGLMAEARYIWNRRLSGESEGTRTTLGASLGAGAVLDLDPLIRFPFAFTGSYRADLPSFGGSRINEVQQAGLGVFYSRRTDLALGLEVLWRHGKIRPGVEPQLQSDSAIGNLWFRYYW